MFLMWVIVLMLWHLNHYDTTAHYRESYGQGVMFNDCNVSKMNYVREVANSTHVITRRRYGMTDNGILILYNCNKL